MELKEAIALLDKIPPIEGTAWGDAIIACREAARRCIDYDSRFSSLMPKDFKDWWENSQNEWPLVAASVMANCRSELERVEIQIDGMLCRIEALTDSKVGE